MGRGKRSKENRGSEMLLKRELQREGKGKKTGDDAWKKGWGSRKKKREGETEKKKRGSRTMVMWVVSDEEEHRWKLMKEGEMCRGKGI